MRLKFHTGRDGNLCRTCDHSQIVERVNGQEQSWCLWIHPPTLMPPDIVKCSAYNHKNEPTQRSMEEIAWVVRVDKAGTVVGFAPPPKKKKED